MDGERFVCRFCGATLVSGDTETNNQHFLDRHVTDYIDQLERGGASEREAHARVNALVESLRTPAG